MKRFMFAVAAACLVFAPASASDFSKLADPAFARSLLISPERGQEAMCAAAAAHQAKMGKGIDVVGAKAMNDLVRSRLLIEIGDDKAVSEIMAGWGEWFDPGPDYQPKDEKLRADVAVELSRRCEGLFASYRKEGTEGLSRLMQPATGLIPLQSVPRCVAIAEYLSVNDPSPMFGKDELGELSEMVHHGLSDSGKAQRDSEIASERASLKQNAPDLQLIQRRGLACLATFRQRAQEVYPERF